MSPRTFSRRRFIRDLTRTRHMTAVSAVVLGTTFMPLLGLPEMYEVRAFQQAVDALSVTQAAVTRDDESARERSAATMYVMQPVQRSAEQPDVEVDAPPLPVEEPFLAALPEPEGDSEVSADEITEAIQPLAHVESLPDIEAAPDAAGSLEPDAGDAADAQGDANALKPVPENGQPTTGENG